jgi:hypothetical protein
VYYSLHGVGGTDSVEAIRAVAREWLTAGDACRDPDRVKAIKTWNGK